MLSQSNLKRLLSYDSETGVFTWREPRKGVRVNSAVGVISSRGYIIIRVYGVCYRAHRLAFLYVYGEIPSDQVDHINGIKTDNRMINLRETDQSENMKNTKKRIDNKSGSVGVHWHKATKKWRAKINANNLSQWQ